MQAPFLLTRSEKEESISGMTERSFSSQDAIKMTGYFDDQQRLVFVIDKSLSELTPFTQLFIEPLTKSDGTILDTKWDMILSENYHISPEAIRPRLNHKYQKLDIFYHGLEYYQRLFELIDVQEPMQLSPAIMEQLQTIQTMRHRLSQDQFSKRLITDIESRERLSKTKVILDKSFDRATKLVDGYKSRLSEQRKQQRQKPSPILEARIQTTEKRLQQSELKFSKIKARQRRNTAHLSQKDRDIILLKSLLKKLENLLLSQPVRPRQAISMTPPVAAIEPPAPEQNLKQNIRNMVRGFDTPEELALPAPQPATRAPAQPMPMKHEAPTFIPPKRQSARPTLPPAPPSHPQLHELPMLDLPPPINGPLINYQPTPLLENLERPSPRSEIAIEETHEAPAKLADYRPEISSNFRSAPPFLTTRRFLAIYYTMLVVTLMTIATLMTVLA